MRIETALKRQRSAISDLRDLFSRAESFGFTSAEINTAYIEILHRLNSCPAWVGEFVNGYRAALTDSLYARSLCHGGFYDGLFYSTHNSRADYYGKFFSPCDWSTWGDNGQVSARGHYWIKHVDNGKPKPFFVN